MIKDSYDLQQTRGDTTTLCLDQPPKFLFFYNDQRSHSLYPFSFFMSFVIVESGEESSLNKLARESGGERKHVIPGLKGNRTARVVS